MAWFRSTACLSPGAGVRELLHGADDAGDVLDAFQRLSDGLGNLRPQIVEVGAAELRFHVLQQFLGDGVGLGGLQQALVGAQQAADVAEGILQEIACCRR